MQFGISEAVQHWGQYRPDSPSVLFNKQITSYKELNRSIDAICLEIDSHNIGAERVAIAVRSKYKLLIAIIAALRAGKSSVLLNVGLPDEALRTNIKDTGISCLIHDSQNEKLVELIQSSNKQILNIDGVLARHETAGKSFQVKTFRQPEDEWGVLFSSGTTGIPKGIERDQNSMVTEFIGWCLELGLTRNTKFYISRPIFYTGGLVLSLSSLLVGGQIIINDFENENDPNEVWADYQKVLDAVQLDWAFFVPDQIRAFIKIAKILDRPPLGAENILVMGAPISSEEKVIAARLLNSNIVESWGNSESLGTITDPEDLEKRPGSIGRPFLTDELYIVDDNLEIQGPGTYGRIAGNEEAGFFQYCNRPDETSRAKQNNLIVSEDIGYMDEDGYFYVRGRQQDCIVIEGSTLFIPDIEHKIRRNAAVEECCITANNVDEVSVELVAVIVPKSGVVTIEQELLEELNMMLDEKEKLSGLLLLSSMPRVPSGKIDRIAVTRLVKDIK